LLAGFELGSISPGSEHRESGLPQAIAQTGGQRRLRTHYHQIHAEFPAGAEQPVVVTFGNRELLAARQFLGATVARTHPDLLHPIAAGEGPGQGVFAAATTHNEHAGGAHSRGSSAHRTA